MPEVTVNGTEIAYEFSGSQQDPVLLLIHGLASPLTAWPESLVEQLVAEGFCVLRFDNRDVGQSQKLDELGTPNLVRNWLKAKFFLPVFSPYSLKDMMADTESLLAALDIERAHVVGASMGGMIAQLLAIHAPKRVKSLTSIMSTTGSRKVPGPTRPVAKHLMSRPKESTPEAILAHKLKTWALIGSPAYPTPEKMQRDYVSGIIERGFSGPGAARQSAAIMAASNRAKGLKKLTVPSLVIHGDSDPLVNVKGGYDTARAIPNASLEIIPGMGHDFPPQLHAKLSQLICGHARANEAS